MTTKLDVELERARLAYKEVRVRAISAGVMSVGANGAKIVKYAAWPAGAWLVAKEIAGKVTIAHLLGALTHDFGVDDWILRAALVMLMAVVWACFRNRGTTIKALATRVKVLEGRLDPERSSSQLTDRGNTNPEDA